MAQEVRSWVIGAAAVWIDDDVQGSSRSTAFESPFNIGGAGSVHRYVYQRPYGGSSVDCLQPTVGYEHDFDEGDNALPDKHLDKAQGESWCIEGVSKGRD